MKKILLIAISSILLITGCSQQPKIRYVTKTKIKYVKLPTYLYRDNIELPKPPSKQDYIIANPYVREKKLILYVIKLMDTISKYKIKLKYIKEYEKRQEAITK